MVIVQSQCGLVFNVTDMSNMFCEASLFNKSVRKWDVAGVASMSYMFHGASSFNQDISKWDVSDVTNMSYMKGTKVQVAVETCCGVPCLELNVNIYFSSVPLLESSQIFLLLIVTQGYLHNSNVNPVDYRRSQEHCNALFDMEDLDCKFL